MKGAGQRVQLHRAISKLGWGSRKQAWEWIVAGEIEVAGQVVRDPLTWIDFGRQAIRRRGSATPAKETWIIALHKPRGYVTTRRDELGRRTVYDLLPPDLPWLFPVGRLDSDSEGLLLLTNDSQLATRLTDPEQHVPKTYRVTVRGRPTADVLRQLAAGVELTDGRTRPAQVRVLEETGSSTTVEMVLTEGRNRQIRRMWWELGFKVRRLVRTAIGRLELGDLPVGEFRREAEASIHRDFV